MLLDSFLRLTVPLVPALAVALLVDLSTLRRGLAPPGFDSPVRRTAMASLLALVFYLGVFSPLAWLDRLAEAASATPEVPELFTLHILLLLSLLAWFILGYGPREHLRGGPLSAAVAQCGLRSREPIRELHRGLVWGLGLWAAVVLAMIVTAALVKGFDAMSLVPDEAPAAVLFMAALPVGVRLALSVSAGFVEEVFFRGFLQPRIGIAASSVLFILAHAGYGEPLMLVGVTVLSFGFAHMVRIHGTVWPAVIAHTLFDALQLLWLIPLQVEAMEQAGGVALGL